MLHPEHVMESQNVFKPRRKSASFVVLLFLQTHAVADGQPEQLIGGTPPNSLYLIAQDHTNDHPNRTT